MAPDSGVNQSATVTTSPVPLSKTDSDVARSTLNCVVWLVPGGTVQLTITEVSVSGFGRMSTIPLAPGAMVPKDVHAVDAVPLSTETHVAKISMDPEILKGRKMSSVFDVPAVFGVSKTIESGVAALRNLNVQDVIAAELWVISPSIFTSRVLAK